MSDTHLLLATEDASEDADSFQRRPQSAWRNHRNEKKRATKTRRKNPYSDTDDLDAIDATFDETTDSDSDLNLVEGTDAGTTAKSKSKSKSKKSKAMKVKTPATKTPTTMPTQPKTTTMPTQPTTNSKSFLVPDTAYKNLDEYHVVGELEEQDDHILLQVLSSLERNGTLHRVQVIGRPTRWQFDQTPAHVATYSAIRVFTRPQQAVAFALKQKWIISSDTFFSSACKSMQISTGTHDELCVPYKFAKKIASHLSLPAVRATTHARTHPRTHANAETASKSKDTTDQPDQSDKSDKTGKGKRKRQQNKNAKTQKKSEKDSAKDQFAVPELLKEGLKFEQAFWWHELLCAYDGAAFKDLYCRVSGNEDNSDDSDDSHSSTSSIQRSLKTSAHAGHASVSMRAALNVVAAAAVYLRQKNATASSVSSLTSSLTPSLTPSVTPSLPCVTST